MKRLLFLFPLLISAQVTTIPNTTFPAVRSMMNANFGWLNTNKAGNSACPANQYAIQTTTAGVVCASLTSGQLTTALGFTPAPTDSPSFTGTVTIGATLLDSVRGPTFPNTGRWMAASYTWNTELTYFAVSADGIHWANASAPGDLYTPTSTYARDHALFRYWDGTRYVYYMAHSGGFNCGAATPQPAPCLSAAIYIAKSYDLVNWTAVGSIPAPVGTSQAFSPTWLLDGSTVYLYFCTGDTHRIYYASAATPAALTTATPVLIPTVVDAIDPAVIKLGSTYQLWYSYLGGGGGTSYVQVAESGSPTFASNTITRTLDWNSWGSPLEGTSLTDMGGGHIRAMFDEQGNGTYYADSYDSGATWSARSLADQKLHHTHPIYVTDAWGINDAHNLLASGMLRGFKGPLQFGWYADAQSQNAISIGREAHSFDPAGTGGGIAFGYLGNANAAYAIAIGVDSHADSGSAISIGHGTHSSTNGPAGAGSTTVGDGSHAKGTQATAIGSNTSADYSHCTALGRDAACTKANQVAVGAAADEVYFAGAVAAVNKPAGCVQYPCVVNTITLAGVTASTGNVFWGVTVAGGMYRVTVTARPTVAGSGGTFQVSAGKTNDVGAYGGSVALTSTEFPSHANYTFIAKANDQALYSLTLGSPTGSPQLSLSATLERLQ